VYLIATNTVAAVYQHPGCRHPLIQPQGGILKDRVDLERELLLAAVAKPQLSCLNKRVLFGTASRTSYLAVRPAQVPGIFKRSVRIVFAFVALGVTFVPSQR